MRNVAVVVMSRERRTYRVIYERDPQSGWWLARVPRVAGCHTQGRTVAEARRRIREALGLFVVNADGARLEDDVRMPAAAVKAVRQFREIRDRAVAEEKRAARAGRMAVQALRRTGLRLSMRDAAEVLGVSHQRVHQLARRAHADDRPSRRK